MRQARDKLLRFVAWWWGELRAMLPSRVPVVDVASAPACDARSSQVVLRLPPEQALQRTLTLPLAAERNLGAVLGFEMDRYTPFKADAVYYGYEPLRRDPAARTLQVALTVVPRKEVDAVIEALRARGIDAAGLQVGGARLKLQPLQRASARAGAWQARALAGLAGALLAAAVALPFWRQAQVIAQLEQELDTVRGEARLAERARMELERLVTEENALLERRKQRPAAIHVLHELTRLLPDTTWLSHLQVSGERVRIRGESSNATELVGMIERSAAFHGASFDGSVTRDPRTDRERFAISLTARPAVPK